VLVKEMAMIEKELVENGGRVRVTFELPSALWADRVNLVGDFNDWDTTATPMARDRTHEDWRVTVVLPVGRRYLFRYLLDGQEWLNEWHADDYVETDDGLCDSVVDLVSAGLLAGVGALRDDEGRRRTP
jgi:1,4-alpha-glucan branching enzyme